MCWHLFNLQENLEGYYETLLMLPAQHIAAFIQTWNENCEAVRADSTNHLEFVVDRALLQQPTLCRVFFSSQPLTIDNPMHNLWFLQSSTARYSTLEIGEPALPPDPQPLSTTMEIRVVHVLRYYSNNHSLQLPYVLAVCH